MLSEFLSTPFTAPAALAQSVPSSEDLERASDVVGAAESIRDQAADAADRAFALIEALPIPAHLIMVGLLVTGFVLWLWGRKLVKPSFGFVGLALGAFAGLFLAPVVGVEELFEIPIWIIALAAGGIIGLVISLFALKSALIGFSAVAFGLIGLLGSIAYVNASSPQPPIQSESTDLAATPNGLAPTEPVLLTPRGDDGLTPRERVRRDIEALGLRLQTEKPARGDSLVLTIDEETGQPVEAQTEVEVVLEHIEQVATTGASYVKAEFDAIDTTQRVTVAGAALGGIVLGVFFAILMPKRSTAVVAALMGSALMLISGVWLAEIAPSPIDAIRPVFEQPPQRWAIIWPAIAVLGLAVQLTRATRKRRRSNAGGD